MITTVYFVRHAEPDYSVHDDMKRPLTKKGLNDAMRLPEVFSKIDIDMVVSSPFKRAYSTVEPIASDRGLEVKLINDFRERKISDGEWIEDFTSFAKNQWLDFNYSLQGGDCLREVQNRNIGALNKLLIEHQGSSIVVGSHGTALSTMINYFDETFGYDEFNKIKAIMPWIVKFTFEEDKPLIEYLDL